MARPSFLVINLGAAFGSLAGIGLHTWGVDFGLLVASGQLIGKPYHYREVRTNGIVEALRPLPDLTQIGATPC